MRKKIACFRMPHPKGKKPQKEREKMARVLAQAGFFYWDGGVHYPYLPLVEEEIKISPTEEKEYAQFSARLFYQQRAIYRAFTRQEGSDDYRHWSFDHQTFPRRRCLALVEEIFWEMSRYLRSMYVQEKAWQLWQTALRQAGIETLETPQKNDEANYWGDDTINVYPVLRDTKQWVRVVLDNPTSARQLRRMLQKAGYFKTPQVKRKKRGKR